MPEPLKYRIEATTDAAPVERLTTAMQRQIASVTGLSAAYKSAGESAVVFATHQATQASIRARVLGNIEASRAGTAASGIDDRTGAVEARIQRRLAAQREETAATQASIPISEAAAAATDKLGLSKAHLGLAIKRLSHEIPGLSLLVHGLKNPYIALAAGVAAALAALRSYFASLNEMEKAAEVHVNLSKAVFTLGGAARDAKTEFDEFNTALDESITKGSTAATEFGKVLDALKKLDVQAAEKRGANEALGLAKINAAEKAGTITPEEAIIQRAELKDRSAQQRQAAADALDLKEQEARREALARTMLRRVGLELDLPGAIAGATEAERLGKARPAVVKSDVEAITQEKAEIEARLKSDRKEIAHLEEKKKVGREQLGDFERRNELAASIAQDESRQTQLIEVEAYVEERTGIIGKRAGKARSKAEAIKGGIKSGLEAEGKLGEEILSGQQALELLRAHRALIAGIEAETLYIETESAARSARDQAQKEADAKAAQLQKEWIDQVARDNQEIRSILKSNSNKSN